MVCCGLTTLDVTQVVDRVPGADEKVVAHSLAVEVGGPAANAARTAATLGRSTTLVTALGSGPLAGLARDELVAAGVAVVDLADDGDPPVSTVLVTRGTGERAVVSTNAVGRAVATPAPEVLDGAAVLLVDGHLLAAQTALAGAARARGTTVVLDGGSWKDGLDDLLPHVDLAVLSADFLPPWLDSDAGTERRDAEVLTAVAGRGPRLVARSHGGSPVSVLHEGAFLELPVPAVEVVDTLGAGDVLHGAVTAALASGAAWADALARGVEVASLSVGHAGAMGWAADLQDRVGRLRAGD
ncbi:sugar/nucleoside kinase (ribokinase family) [Georgenia soli]|uniref:Sugar/nucleoside kinase (Ribokinase family) n=1 Tax=Georgenia soli TaxID=638953 RepID=A0A2A9EIM9_9MICO|nr:sugar/nucleoside kinase (ribokinase family) [Georgenia soli]